MVRYIPGGSRPLRRFPKEIVALKWVLISSPDISKCFIEGDQRPGQGVRVKEGREGRKGREGWKGREKE